MINNTLKVNYSGWIKKQLEIQANGLFGSLDKVWNDIKDSKWIGGNSEGWERFPYYLNGLIPLAYALNDKQLIDKANKYIDSLITSQKANGSIVPKNDTDPASNDIWPLFLILKVISIYGELSQDERTIRVIEKALYYIDGIIKGSTIINWAHARYFECYIPMLYLKKNTKSKKTHAFIKELAIKLKAQGLDYSLISKQWIKTSKWWAYDNHGVNIAMALKCNELFEKLTGIKSDGNAKEMIDILDKYHGTIYGHYTSDECLDKKTPYHGAELCGIVEAMYSYEILFSLTNDTYYLDRLELLAFNALPASCLDNMWAHQYDQQVNQIACVPFKGKVIFKTNTNDANVFGLEPNYGCCTANFGQGWPLFALSAFSKVKNGIQINVPLSGKIEIDEDKYLICESEYPFRKTIKLLSNCDLKVKLRIPGSCNILGGYKVNKGFININLLANKEKTINLEIKPQIKDNDNKLSYLTYGNLLFSLPIKHKMETNEYIKKNVERKYPYCDYHFIPVGKYKYAFNSDVFEVIEQDYESAFNRDTPPLLIKGEFVEVEWKNKSGYQYVLQDVPKHIKTKTKAINMKPYGATYLRMTEMLNAKNNKN